MRKTKQKGGRLLAVIAAVCLLASIMSTSMMASAEGEDEGFAFPTKCAAIALEGGELLELGGSYTMDAAEVDGAAIQMMCLTVTELFDMDLLPLLGDIVPEEIEAFSINDILDKDFDGLAEWAGLTQDDLDLIVEGFGTEYPDLAAELEESYTSFNAFAADALAAFGMVYTPEDSLGGWLLDLINTLAEAMEMTPFTSLPAAFIGLCNAAMEMEWTEATPLGVMYNDLLDVKLADLIGMLPSDGEGDEGEGSLIPDMDPDMTLRDYIALMTGMENTGLYMVNAVSSADPLTLKLHHDKAADVALTAVLDGKALTVTNKGNGDFELALPRDAGNHALSIQVSYTGDMADYADMGMEKEDLNYYYNVALRVNPSEACKLTAFTLAGVAGVIDEANKTVAVTLPAGTDVSALTPDKVEVSYKAAHDAAGAKDYSKEVALKVTAEDGVHTATYTVKVTVQAQAKPAEPSEENPPTGVPAATGVAALGLGALALLFIARKRRGGC